MRSCTLPSRRRKEVGVALAELCGTLGLVIVVAVVAGCSDRLPTRAVEAAPRSPRLEPSPRALNQKVATPPSLTIAAGDGWRGQVLPGGPRAGRFTATYNVTPSRVGLDGVVSLSKGPVQWFDDGAVQLRFDPGANTISVRRGDSYSYTHAATYSAGVTYTVVANIDVPNHVVDVTVAAPIGQPVLVAQRFPFRTSQGNVDALDTISAIVDGAAGSLTVSGVVTSSGTDGLQVIPPRDQRVTSGKITTLPDGRARIDDPVTRTRAETFQAGHRAALEFTYLGPTFLQVPLGDGTYRVQFGLLRETDPCHVISVIWRVSEHSLVVSAKDNPADQTTSAQCADRGWVNLSPSVYRPPPVPQTATTYQLTTELDDAGELTVRLNDQVVWKGSVASALKQLQRLGIPVYHAVRADNASIAYKLFGDRAASPTSQATSFAQVFVTASGTGGGSVTVSSSRMGPCPGPIVPGQNCNMPIQPGDVVRAVATPNAGSMLGWSGACSGSNSTCTFTITPGGIWTAAAMFSPVPSTDVNYSAHVQNRGWVDCARAQVCGAVPGVEDLRLEAMRITAPGRHICYSIEVQAPIFWTAPVCDGAVAGTTGQSLRTERLKIWVDRGHVTYYLHVQNRGWMGPYRDGEIGGTTGYGLKIAAVAIVVSDDNSLGLAEFAEPLIRDIGAEVQCGWGASNKFPFVGRSPAQKDFTAIVWINPFYRLFGPSVSNTSNGIKIISEGPAVTSYDDGALKVDVLRKTDHTSLIISKYPAYVEVQGTVNAVTGIGGVGGIGSFAEDCDAHLWVRVTLIGRNAELQPGKRAPLSARTESSVGR